MDLIVITGPRAAGKTWLAWRMATSWFPHAVVLDEHPRGAEPTDKDLAGRFFSVSDGDELEAALRIDDLKGRPAVILVHGGEHLFDLQARLTRYLRPTQVWEVRLRHHRPEVAHLAERAS